jgi:hypothetical protein
VYWWAMLVERFTECECINCAGNAVLHYYLCCAAVIHSNAEISCFTGMSDPYEKSQPGRDQNHVLDSMRIGRGTFGLKYAYFSTDTAPLLDKLVLKEGNTMELGGEAIQGWLDAKQSIAMHTTCYEKSTKVMGLKVSCAFSVLK